MKSIIKPISNIAHWWVARWEDWWPCMPLFTATDLFEGYVAASPHMAGIAQWSMNTNRNGSKKCYQSARLYMTIGDVEKRIAGLWTISESFIETSANNTFYTIENIGKHRTLRYKSRRFFTRLAICIWKTLHSSWTNNCYANIPELIRSQMEATWNWKRRMTGWWSISMATTVSSSMQTVIPISMQKNEFMNLHFTVNGEVVEGFNWTGIGNSQFAKKIMLSSIVHSKQHVLVLYSNRSWKKN